MIQIATDMLRVLDRDGQPVLLDMGQMEHHLAEAFRRIGSQEVWLASRIALTVEEKIRRTDATPMRETEVDGLVMSALKASGYADVAVEYAKLRHRDLMEEAFARMRSWNGEELRALCLRSLPLSKEAADALAARVGDALRTLGMSEATEAFLVDFAIHLLRGAKHAAPSESAWRERISERSERMLAEGIVVALPAKGLFSMAAVLVNISSLIENLADGWTSEFALCGAFGQLAPAVLEILRCQREELVRLSPEDASHAALLVFPGFHLFLENRFSQEEERESFQRTLCGLVEERIVKDAGFPVSVYCK